MSKTKLNIVLKQIKADEHNIQVMIDMLPHVKNTQYNKIQNAIKQLVKQIKKQKEFINYKLNPGRDLTTLLLFEVEPSEIEQDFSDMNSFFGLI